MNKLKRIQKEYKDLTLNPIENIIIIPESDNIYIWHYVILGNVLPYKNGHYYGKLTLHEDYPMKAPQIIMITPNGRFKTNTRLCFSMSDYHQETWSPNWNIRTIMIGFYSFMLEESATEGSIECDYNTRLLLAQQSQDFNNSHETFKNIFNAPLCFNLSENQENQEEKQDKICKFCYESSGELINACNCKGTHAYIHKECLHNWQLQTILNQSTHPDYQINSDTICSVCNSEFKIKNKSRKNIMEELTGEIIIEQIKLGYIFISSKESSLHNLDLIKKYKSLLFYENIMHWTYGVFLIVESNSNGIIAINTNRNIEESNNNIMYLNNYNRYLKIHNLDNIINEENIYIGGPCEDKNIYGLIYINNLDDFNVTLKNVKIIKKFENKYVIFGDYIYIYKLYHVKPENVIHLHVYCGYAGWSYTQLLSEFAKTTWGITNINCDILFIKNNYDLIKQDNCLFVKANIYSDNK